MIRFSDYFLIQIKRIIRLLPVMLSMTVVSLIIVGSIFYAVFNSDSFRLEQVRYKLGVVGFTSDNMLTMGVDLLQNNDDSRFMLDIIQYDKEAEARKALRNGDISAYVLITDEFVNSLNALTNDISLEYFATSGQRGITNIMMDEMADIASELVVSSEKGLLSLEQEMENAGFPASTTNDHVERLLLLYVGAMLARGNIAEFSVSGLADGLTTIEYYGISLSLFFMLLMTFSSISFFLGKKKATYQFIKSKGMNAGSQVLAEYLAYLLLNIMSVIFGILLIKCLLIYMPIDFDLSVILSNIKSILNIIPAVLLFTAMSFLIFDAIEGVINKMLAGFILYIGMAYMSGYFYPRTFFPDSIQSLGNLLPTGVAFNYMEGNGEELIVILLYTVIFLASSIAIRRQKIK